MTLDKDVTDFYAFTRDNFHLEGYHPLEFDEKSPLPYNRHSSTGGPHVRT